MSRPHDYECPYCGANLDAGERCDCEDESLDKQPAADEEEEHDVNRSIEQRKVS